MPNMPIELNEAYAELTRGCEEVLPSGELKKKLIRSHETSTPLIIKAGFDPTAPDLHLGHSVLINKLRVFQELGHEVQFLIGDYTGMIGDPTGRSETRIALTKDEVQKNAETYKEQVFKILDKDKTKVVFNSHWLSTVNLEKLLQLTSFFTVAQMLERDDFSKRYKAGQSISIVEFLYPLMQGYDSVVMKADVELGGTDQKFNLLVGRHLQTAFKQAPQVVMTLPLLVGLDGEKKMSKSYNNYIGLKESAMDIFGKIMSLSDDLMWNYYQLLSFRSLKELESLKNDVKNGTKHPKKIKEDLALEMSARFHSKETAEQAAQEWHKVHNPSERGIPSQISTIELASEALPSLLMSAGMVSSKSEARRLMKGGGVYELTQSEEIRLDDPYYIPTSGSYTIRVGKRKFVKIIIK